MDGENYKCFVGHVARCRKGKLGVVTNIYKVTGSDAHIWKGIGLDGRPWQSQYPEYVANSVDNYIEQCKIKELTPIATHNHHVPDSAFDDSKGNF
jgi:hypothetical protein